MTTFASTSHRGDGRLWAIAFGVSLLGNVVVFGFAVFVALESEKFHQRTTSPSKTAAATEEATVIISPDMIQKVMEKSATTAAAASPTPPAVAPASKPEFARTSEDQTGKRPDRPAFIGERNTEATSDRAPDPNAPAMPSQRGIEPKDATDFETTESRYQDGSLDAAGAPSTDAQSPSPSTPAPQPNPAEPMETPAAAENPASQAEPAKEIADQETKEAPAPAELLQGTNPVDVNIPKPTPEKSLPPSRPTPAENPAKVTPDQQTPSTVKPAPKPGEPGFRGYQRKTAIQGSISRTGRSALDVVDSPLGRYQAVISRAVELEWQRNCVRHRDFITPGFLTVRFFIQSNGKVKSVQFMGQMETGEVQKGFTLNSIRDAAIPPMPKEIRAEYAEEPLELIFNFYF